MEAVLREIQDEGRSEGRKEEIETGRISMQIRRKGGKYITCQSLIRIYLIKKK